MSKIIIFFAIVLIFVCNAFPSQELTKELQEDNPRRIAELLRSRIEMPGVASAMRLQSKTIYAIVALPLFYERRHYQPAWIENGKLKPEVNAMLRSIYRSEAEGLQPRDYHLNSIKTLLSKIARDQEIGRSSIQNLVDIDILLTDAFLVLGTHFLNGRIHPDTMHLQWSAQRENGNLVAILEAALKSRNIEKALAEQLPSQEGYSNLRNALYFYRELWKNGGWSKIPEDKLLRLGDQDIRIGFLRKRLLITGDIDSYHEGENFFDLAMESAVMHFQKRYGLNVDGIVGPLTFAALNTPIETQLRRIELNLERWRWLPQELGKRQIIVNIAEFKLYVREETKNIMEMRVVVGRPYRRTPIFSDVMTYLVLNPSWYIPRRIAIYDIVPLLRKNPFYLQQKGIRIFAGWGAEKVEIFPDEIDWEKINAKNFYFHFEQMPGPDNALGQVKFMLPNKYNVYLHDTPAKELFERDIRSFSSGCIRVEKPIELAEYLLKGLPVAERKELMQKIESEKEVAISLPDTIFVHILYWTAWADNDGIVHFRQDIYGRDKRLEKVLALPPPLNSNK